MAIDLGFEYPGRVTPADANYPFASAVNESVPGAGDGTPYELLRANDLIGLMQGLLVATNIIPSGSPDTVLVSQYLQALGELIAGRATTYDSGGVVNAYVLTLPSGQHPPQALFDGFTVHVTPHITNTGTTTVDVEGLGPTPLRIGTNEINQGAFYIDQSQTLVYDGVLASFQLMPDLRNLNVQTTADLSSLSINLAAAADVIHQHVTSAQDNFHRFTSDATGTTNTDGFVVGYNSTLNGILWNYENAAILIGTNNISRFIFSADGGLFATQAAGGSQGVGTINAEGLFVDGVEVLPQVSEGPEDYRQHITATTLNIVPPDNTTSVTVIVAGGGGGGGGGDSGDGAAGGDTTVVMNASGNITTIVATGGGGGAAAGGGGGVRVNSTIALPSGDQLHTNFNGADGEVGFIDGTSGDGGGGLFGSGGAGSAAAATGNAGVDGGGGAGGSAGSNGGSGGASTCYVQHNIPIFAPANTDIDITIGAGGAGGVGTQTGGAGGDGFVILQFNS
jgi:hypothetical protein